MKKLTIASVIALVASIGLIAQDGAQVNIGAGLNSAFTAFISPNGTANGPILLPDGISALPSLAFASQPNTGIYHAGVNDISISSNGARIVAFAGADVYLLNTTPTIRFGASSDVIITRDAANILALKNGTNNQIFRVYNSTTGSTYLSMDATTIAGVANVGANSCGTTAATITGVDTSSVITVGTVSGTQCRIAFAVAATTAWDCVANDDTTTIAVRTTPVDTTHTDVIGTFTAGDKITTHCWPR